MKIDTNKTIVINWFDRKTLQEIVREQITKEQYADFKDWLKDSGIDDETTGLIRDYWADFND